jgi:hypothetical protein
VQRREEVEVEAKPEKISRLSVSGKRLFLIG